MKLLTFLVALLLAEYTYGQPGRPAIYYVGNMDVESKRFRKIIAAHIYPSDSSPFGTFSVQFILFRTYGKRYLLD